MAHGSLPAYHHQTAAQRAIGCHRSAQQGTQSVRFAHWDAPLLRSSAPLSATLGSIKGCVGFGPAVAADAAQIMCGILVRVREANTEVGKLVGAVDTSASIKGAAPDGGSRSVGCSSCVSGIARGFAGHRVHRLLPCQIKTTSRRTSTVGFSRPTRRSNRSLTLTASAASGTALAQRYMQKAEPGV